MAFTASAPGKIILFGEHAVVYGVPAIATSVALRTYVTVSTPPSDVLIELRMPDLKFELDLTAADFAAFPNTKNAETKSLLDAAVPSKLDEDVHTAAQNLAAVKLEGRSKLHHAAVTAFLYLYATIYLPRSSTPATFTVRSSLPLGAGLGSSASLSVALAGALLRAAGVQSSEIANEPAKVVDAIVAHSFLGECCMHGNPSGVDNLVAARGGAVYFDRSGGKPTFRPYANVPEIPLLLTDTTVSRSTAELVSRVRGVKERWPVLFDKLMDSFSQIVSEADALLAQGAGSDESVLIDKLGELAELNHGLLVTLAVSHDSLERVVNASKQSGVGRTKLTGAGGGGCAITFLNGMATDEQRGAFSEALGPGFNVFGTGVGGPGIGFADGTANSTEALSNLKWVYPPPSK